MISALKRALFALLRALSTAYAKTRVGGCGEGFTVNYPSWFTRQTHIGRYCHFNGMQVVGGGKLTIGDYFHSGSGVLVLTANHNYKNPTKLPYDEEDILRDVSIGHYVWIGSRAILLPGAQLGDGCVVQAGAVVGGVFPPNTVLGGNPAVALKTRDPELVAALVADGKFLL